jgi:hypothetical protein
LDNGPSASRAFTAVNCLPAGLCVAVDNAGYATTGTFSDSRHEGHGGQGPPPVSNVFTIRHTTVRCRGRVLLSLSTPSAGTLAARAITVSATRAKGARRKQKHRRSLYGVGSAKAGGGGTVRLTISPRPTSRRMLRHSKKLGVSVAITFLPDGGSPRTRHKKIVVRWEECSSR